MKNKIFTQNLRNNLLLLLLALVLSVVIWLFAMQAMKPVYTWEFTDIPVTVSGGVCSERVKAVFPGTKETLYDYRLYGIRAEVDITEGEPGNLYHESLRFYCGDTEIFPVAEVKVMVTATGASE